MVNDWVNKNYEEIKGWIKGAIKYENDSVKEDLFHEVLMIFIQHPKAEQLIENNEARWFIVRVALNQSRSKSSDHYKLYKKQHLVEYKEISEIKVVEYDLDKDNQIENVLNILDEMYKGTNRERYYVMLILLYFTLGNFAEMSRRLNIPRTTIKKNFKEGLEHIKSKMFTDKTTDIKFDNKTLKILKTKILESYGRKTIQ
jgi:DNA-directed RNA polymerase specialized sigma24 family protein